MKKASFFKNNYLKLLFMIAIVLGCLWIGSQVQAGSITLNSLDFEIQLNEDGSMDVVETWNIDIRYTNTLYKTFEK